MNKWVSAAKVMHGRVTMELAGADADLETHFLCA